MDGKTLMASHGPRDELDEVLDALLRAVPPQQQEEVRVQLQATHDPGPDNQAIAHRLALTPHDDLHEAAGAPPSSISALDPVPSITPENIAQIVDDLVHTV